MKSLFQKTIISLLMLGIFLAPLSNRVPQTLFAEETETVIYPIVAVDITHDSGIFNITIQNAKSGYKTDNAGKNFNVFLYSKLPTSDPLIGLLDGKGFLIQENKSSQEIRVTFKNTNNTTFLVANTVYFIKAQLQQGDQIFQTIISFKTDSSANTNDGAIVGEGTSEILEETTTTGGQYGSGTVTRIGAASLDFHCAIIGNGTVEGCFAMLIYKAFFVPLAFFTRLSANLLDFFVYYSTDSKPYQSDFIAKAWGVVRDIANIFFIITLLFVAIKTVLGLNVSNNKKLISYVIVIALVINFSLFTTRVIVDASNILAKIFYNNFTPIDETGKKLDPNSDGQKSITVGLVKTFDPVSIFGKTNKQIQNNYNNNIGTFIIITLFAIILMGFMIYIFLSVALLFLARTVGLWMQMIFSPLAFASYSVPFEIPGFGHKEWWTNLFKYAFLAPIFIFFLYIIFLLGDALNTVVFDVAEAGESVDPIRALLDQFIKVTIPFAVIFILLKQAKKLATQYAGEIGAAIQKGGALVGSLALGGVGLGTAALGRVTVGRIAAASSRTNDAMKYGRERIKFDSNLREWEKTKVGPRPSWKEHADAAGIKRDPWTALGGKINASQMLVADVGHARHELDETKKKADLEGVSNANLSGVEKQKIKDTYTKEHRSEIEADIIRGHNAKGKAVTYKDSSGTERTAESQSGFNARRRPELIADMRRKGDRDDVDTTTGELTDQGKKKVEDQLKSEFNIQLKDLVLKVGENRFNHLEHEAAVKVGTVKKVAARSTSGSYDVRNLPGLKSDKREGFSTKATIGLIAAVATGIRAGLKTTLKVDAGTPQKDVGKDLKDLITSALKNVKIDLNVGDNSGKSHDATHHGGTAGDHSGH